MAAGHFLKVTDEEINYIVSKKMHINFVQCFFPVSLGRFLQQVGQETCHLASTNVIKVMRDGSCQPRQLYGSLIEVKMGSLSLILVVICKW